MAVGRKPDTRDEASSPPGPGSGDPRRKKVVHSGVAASGARSSLSMQPRDLGAILQSQMRMQLSDSEDGRDADDEDGHGSGNGDDESDEDGDDDPDEGHPNRAAANPNKPFGPSVRASRPSAPAKV